MSSRNLLASIFDKSKLQIQQNENKSQRDSHLQTSRGISHASSSSLFSKSNFVGTLQEPGIQKRSLSIDNLNHASIMPKPKSNNSLLPLIRAMHTLSVKIKKWNYFFFCRLESMSKQQKNRGLNQSFNFSSTPSRNFDKNIEIFESSLQNSYFVESQQCEETQGQNEKLDYPLSARKTSQQESYNRINRMPQNQSIKQSVHFKKQGYSNSYSSQEYSSFTLSMNKCSIEEGINKFSDSFSLIQFKKFNQKKLRFAFERIKRKSSKTKNHLQKLVCLYNNQRRKAQEQAFRKLKWFDKVMLKIQIFSDALNHQLIKYIKVAFQQIKNSQGSDILTYRGKKQRIKYQSNNTEFQQNLLTSHRLKSISEQGSFISDDEACNSNTNQSFSLASSNFQNYHNPIQQEKPMQFTFSSKRSCGNLDCSGCRPRHKSNNCNQNSDYHQNGCFNHQANCQSISRNSTQCSHQHSRSVLNPSTFNSKKQVALQNSRNSQQDSINNGCHSFRTQPKNAHDSFQNCNVGFLPGHQQCLCYGCVHNFAGMNARNCFFPFDNPYLMMNMNSMKNHQLFFTDTSTISQSNSRSPHKIVSVKPNISKICSPKQSSKAINCLTETREDFIEPGWTSKFKEHENMKSLKPLNSQTQPIAIPQLHDNFNTFKSIKGNPLSKVQVNKQNKQLQDQDKTEDYLMSKLFKSRSNSNNGSINNSLRNSQRNSVGGIKYAKALKALNSLQHIQSLFISGNQQKSKSKQKYSSNQIKSTYTFNGGSENGRQQSKQAIKNQLPFEKISEMLMGLQKIRQKQKTLKSKAQKSTKNALRNKNLNCSLNNRILSEKGYLQVGKQKAEQIQKTQQQYQSSGKKLYASKSKQNQDYLTSKIWQSKDKFLFYPQKLMRTAKKPSSNKSNMNQTLNTPQNNRQLGVFMVQARKIDKNVTPNRATSQNRNAHSSNHTQITGNLTTARKMQMELEQIMNRKNKSLSQMRQNAVQRKHMKAFH